MDTQKAKNISRDNLEAVILDVDGTLYSQSRLRRLVVPRLALFYALRPWRYRELNVIRDFRLLREKQGPTAEGDLGRLQYRWVSDKRGMPEEKVKRIVDYWLLQFPLPYLKRCAYEGLYEFISSLRTDGIKIACYSDYPAAGKLEALDLEVDLAVCSLDEDVDRFKPDPKGLLVTAEKLGVPVSRCVFIGDRQDRDGDCARRAGMRFVPAGKAAEEQSGRPFSFLFTNLPLGLS